jgi:toluene monooxygenase system protein D
MSSDDPARKRSAGPLLRSGDTTDAIIDALHDDNPDTRLVVRDHSGYIRVEGDNGLVLTRASAERALGRPFKMQEIEILMAGYSGKIELTEEHVRWYFKTGEPAPAVAGPTERGTVR